MSKFTDMTPAEVKELLAANTENITYNSEVIKNGYEEVFAIFAEDDNYIMEEKALWNTILMAFFNFDKETIVELEDKLGWYHLMVWCYQNLKKKPEIEYYFNRYFDYHKEKMSAGQMIAKFITAFIDDLGNIGTDQLMDYATDLGRELKKLPDMVKDQL